MAKSPPKLTKVVSEANLEKLGVKRLASLLVEAGAGDAGFKRRLRLELAAELGAPDLALELDKRLQTLASGRGRISWRKRPDLIRELRSLRALVADRLADLDPKLALDRLVAWFDLLAQLSARTKDPKNELALVFDEATPDLARVASLVGPDVAAPLLLEALSTRSAQWASFIGRGAGDLSVPVAKRLLKGLAGLGSTMSGRTTLVARKLADRTGDLDAWLATLTDADLRRPEVRSEAALRLAFAHRPVEARAMLDAALGSPSEQPRALVANAGPRDDAWDRAEIAVLEAEDRGEDAMEARWRLFERSLSADTLRDVISRLGDFEDVVATDRALAFAARYFDPMKGIAFLMNWGAHREAADVILARRDELRGNHEDVALWASRLSVRFPAAALLLLRARARALVALGAGSSPEAEAVLGEAEALAAAVDHNHGLGTHGDFLTGLNVKLAALRPRPWRSR